MIIFFLISFITNIIGPLIPDIIQSFNLSLTAAGILPFSFFIAYGLFSMPSGYLIEFYGEKKIIIIGLLISLIGSLFFSLYTNYFSGIVSLLLIGTGMAILQVTINPLLRSTTNAENFAFFSIMGQFFFGLASFFSPICYVEILSNKVISFIYNFNPKWIVIYWTFSIISLLLIFIISISKFPIKKHQEEKIEFDTLLNILNNKWSYLYFFGIFFYVGTEQGINTWASQFLYSYHNLNPQLEGAKVISFFWGNMTIGTLAGLVLIKLFDSKKLLIFLSCLSILILSFGLFGGKWIAVIAISSLGLSISSMWSIIIALALNSFEKNHGTVSGIMMTGIAGGAIYPFIIGFIGDFYGLKLGLFTLYISLSYILFLGWLSKPKVLNKKVNLNWLNSIISLKKKITKYNA